MIKVTTVMVATLALMAYLFRDTLFQAPAAAPATFERLAALPREVRESSGIVVLPQDGHYLTHNDAGNRPYLYKLNEQGKLLQTYKLNLKNIDWEDLTMDDSGYIYIADTGNNDNDRRDLTIYKVNASNMSDTQPIRYTYEDQGKYPPKKKERNFDVEAIFWHSGSLYLISRDRGRRETAKVYRVPDTPGNHQAKLIGSHKLKAQVTGAAISPDRQTVVLLSDEKLHLYTGFDAPAAFYEGTYEEVQLPGAGQTEGVAFENDRTLIITSEGGNLYRYSR